MAAMLTAAPLGATEPDSALDATLLASAGDTPGQTEPQAPAVEANGDDHSTPAPDTIAPTTEAPLSDAERIARLQRSLTSDASRLDELRGSLARQENELADAEREFGDLDQRLEEAKRRLAEAQATPQAEGSNPPVLDAELVKRRQLAKERFDLVIQERKALVDQVATLEKKIEHDHELIERIKGIGPPPPAAPAAAESTNLAAAPTPPATGPAAPATVAPETTAPPPSHETPTTAALQTLVNPLAQPTGLVEPAAESNTAAQIVAPRPVDNARVRAATANAQQKEQAAQDAEETARSVSRRAANLREDVAHERSLLQNARRRADNADETLKSLEAEFQVRLLGGAQAPELFNLRQQIAECSREVREARTEGRQHAQQLDELQTELVALQSEEIAALSAAAERRREAESAREAVARLENPFAPRNLLEWLLHHGARIVLILASMVGFVWGSRLLQDRIVQFVGSRAARGPAEEQENRARTLVGVFRYAANVAIVAGGSLMLLDEIGISIAPLMGGAAVFGLAVAFGAQSLIKDYFSGFMILMEQQYLVGDVIRISDIAGQVERITLRVTVLRDLEGRVHFVPHGQITSTTNLTHGWSRAVFDVAVAYREDVDHVMQILVDLANELRRDHEFGPLILEPATMLGVDSLGDSAVVIKFHLKTRPLRQWPVKRELLRRIKKRFDELGIEIPFPHRTIYYQNATTPPLHSFDESRQRAA